MSVHYTKVKWNTFLKNLEFCTVSNELYTFWRINSDSSLQYQHGDFDEKKLESKVFTSIEYSPPLSCNCVILLLVGLSSGEIWGIDTKTNSINIIYKPKIEKPINIIICSLQYVSVIYKNCIKYYKMPQLTEVKYDNLNILSNKEELLELDSDIIGFDLDLNKSNVSFVY